MTRETASLVRQKTPQQRRSQQKVAAIMAAAEALLVDVGPEAVSIPEVAKASGILRASVYQFFPDKYALIAAIAEHHLERVARLLADFAPRTRDLDMPTLIERLVDGASDYYDATPVASIVVLGGPFSQRAYLAQTRTIIDIGGGVRTMLAACRTPLDLPEDPDAATLCVEIAFACMKHGYYRDGHLSRQTRRETTAAATAYLRLYG